MLPSHPDICEVVFSQMDMRTVIVASSVCKLFYTLCKQIYKTKPCICTVKIWIRTNSRYDMCWEIGEFESKLPSIIYDDDVEFGFWNYLCCKYLLTLEQIRNIVMMRDNKLKECKPGDVLYRFYNGSKLINVSWCPNNECTYVPITIDTRTSTYIMIDCSGEKYTSDIYLKEKKENWVSIILPPGARLVD